MADPKFKRAFSLCAFVGVVFIAFALLLQVIFKNSNIASTVGLAGEVIAYVITLVTAFTYVRAKRNTALTVTFAIAATAIITLFILKVL